MKLRPSLQQFLELAKGQIIITSNPVDNEARLKAWYNRKKSSLPTVSLTQVYL